MLSGGNSCAEHEGQGRGSAQGKVSGTPESREFQTAGISDPSQRGCSGKGRAGGPGKHCQQSPGALEWEGGVGPFPAPLWAWGTGKHWNRGAVQLCCEFKLKSKMKL